MLRLVISCNKVRGTSTHEEECSRTLEHTFLTKIFSIVLLRSLLLVCSQLSLSLFLSTSEAIEKTWLQNRRKRGKKERERKKCRGRKNTQKKSLKKY